MKALFCGDRNWKNKELIHKVMRHLFEYCNMQKNLVIHGNAHGADRIAAICACELHIEVKSFPANWNQFGKAAGQIRNKQMLDECNPDIVIAFHNDIESSKGTKNMIMQATKRNIPVKIYSEREHENAN